MALSRSSKVFLGIVVVIVAVVVAGLWYVNDQLGGVPGEGDPVSVTVPKGASAAQVGQLLASEHVVKSALAFRLVARSRGLGSSLRAGDYDFQTGMSVDEAIGVLQDGPKIPEGIRFTVPEGLTVTDTLDRLAKQTPYTVQDYQQVLQKRLDAGGNADGTLQLPSWVPDLKSFPPAVRQPFEGLLFPNTYEVSADASAQDVLQKMVDQLTKVVSQISPDDVAKAKKAGLDRYQALIVASLIERETRVADERPKVAGVIYNRLAKDMPLQIDATVLYARGEHTDRVLTQDTEIDSPYNTYKVSGLPPTPISGMGQSAIQAAFAPANHDFLYYVLQPGCNGRHVFAATLEEHNKNVQAFRDAGGCQQQTPAPTPSAAASP